MNPAASMKPIEVLSVEDNLADARLIEEFLVKMGRVKTRLNFVRNGVEAMDFLLKRGIYESAKTPALILLDLNLPMKDGREVLREIKENPELRSIPVLVFTTSSRPDDIHASYGLHANCYFTKPSDLAEFNTTMRTIEQCWLSTAKLPQDAF